MPSFRLIDEVGPNEAALDICVQEFSEADFTQIRRACQPRRLIEMAANAIAGTQFIDEINPQTAAWYPLIRKLWHSLSPPASNYSH